MMKKILDILALLLMGVIVLIETGSRNYIVLAILYYILIASVYYHYRYIIIGKKYYNTDEGRPIWSIILNNICFYAGIGGVFTLWSDWTSYPWYLLLPRLLVWIMVGIFPIIYYKNLWKKE